MSFNGNSCANSYLFSARIYPLTVSVDPITIFKQQRTKFSIASKSSHSIYNQVGNLTGRSKGYSNIEYVIPWVQLNLLVDSFGVGQPSSQSVYFTFQLVGTQSGIVTGTFGTGVTFGGKPGTINKMENGSFYTGCAWKVLNFQSQEQKARGKVVGSQRYFRIPGKNAPLSEEPLSQQS